MPRTFFSHGGNLISKPKSDADSDHPIVERISVQSVHCRLDLLYPGYKWKWPGSLPSRREDTGRLCRRRIRLASAEQHCCCAYPCSW